MTAQLAVSGIAWRAVTPSLWQQRDLPVSVEFDGDGWLIRVCDYPPGFRRFGTRDAAMAWVAESFQRGISA